jgi:predicted MFS family arabinose efflux permease
VQRRFQVSETVNEIEDDKTEGRAGEGVFRGWYVAWSAFTVAVFAWGVGFYGPSVFLQTLHQTRGWPISAISSAITAHYLLSALIIIYLPEIYRRLGLAGATATGAVLSAVGLLIWSGAAQPWQLFGAAAFSGAGWAVTSGAALNAMVVPWFDRGRPQAISLAFNGASVGGIVFIPLWLALIGAFGFQIAAAVVGAAEIAVVGTLAFCFLRYGPKHFGQHPDGDAVAHPHAAATAAPAASRWTLMRSRRFVTLSAAFAIGLFAQVGLLSHLLVRLSPALGLAAAGAAVSVTTVCAVIGRTLMGALIGDRDRRLAAAANFALQAFGTALLIVGTSAPPLWLGCALFGLGLGNLTSLPPLIAQKEFARADVTAVVALVIAINQATFAFAPAVFGVVREAATDYTAAFSLAAIAQLVAAAIILTGRRGTKVATT